jgi:hypothetical protein
MAKKRSNEIWLDVEEAPRSGLPDTAKNARRAKTLRIFVWASVVLFPIALLALIGTAGSSSEVPAATAGQSSKGRIAATGALEAWLDSPQSPLPDGELISWDGAVERTSEVVEPTGDGAGYTVTTESNTFTVGVRIPEATTTTTTKPAKAEGSSSEKSTTTTAATTTTEGDSSSPAADETDTPTISAGDTPSTWSATYQVEVLVALDSRGGAIVVSQPSIIPIPSASADSWAPSTPTWTGLTSTQAPENVKTAASRWTDAYVSGDADDLRLATGDPTETNVYTPLVGPLSATTEVTAAASADEGVTMVVRVSITARWPGQPDPADDSTDSDAVTPPFELDLLVEGADTGAPVVVAWGPPGSGADLTAYSNAVTGDRELATTTSTTEAPTTTTEATTTTTAPKAKPKAKTKPKASTTTTTKPKGN